MPVYPLLWLVYLCMYIPVHTVQTDRSSINAEMQSEMESKMLHLPVGTRNQPKAFNQVAEIQVPGSSLCTLALKPQLFKGKSNAAFKVRTCEHVDALKRFRGQTDEAKSCGSCWFVVLIWLDAFTLAAIHPAPKAHVKHGQLPVICGALNVSGSSQQHGLGIQSDPMWTRCDSQQNVKSSCSHVDRGSVNGLQSVLAHATKTKRCTHHIYQSIRLIVEDRFNIFLHHQFHHSLRPSFSLSFNHSNLFTSWCNPSVRRGRKAGELKVLLGHEANSCLGGNRPAFWQTPCLTVWRAVFFVIL